MSEINDIDLLQLVMDGMGWEKKKAQRWFNTPSPLLGGATPNGFELMRGKAKLEKFIRSQIEENGPPKRNIEFNSLIGQMKGTIEMLLLLYGQQMEPHQIEHIKNLITKYEDYFKHR